MEMTKGITSTYTVCCDRCGVELQADAMARPVRKEEIDSDTFRIETVNGLWCDPCGSALEEWATQLRRLYDEIDHLMERGPSWRGEALQAS